jgi:hypothetical protein
MRQYQMTARKMEKGVEMPAKEWTWMARKARSKL